MMEKDRKKIHGWDKIMKSIEEKHSVLSCQLAVTKELEEQRVSGKKADRSGDFWFQVNLELLLTEKLRFNEIYGTRVSRFTSLFGIGSTGKKQWEVGIFIVLFFL